MMGRRRRWRCTLLCTHVDMGRNLQSRLITIPNTEHGGTTFDSLAEVIDCKLSNEEENTFTFACVRCLLYIERWELSAHFLVLLSSFLELHEVLWRFHADFQITKLKMFQPGCNCKFRKIFSCKFSRVN